MSRRAASLALLWQAVVALGGWPSLVAWGLIGRFVRRSSLDQDARRHRGRRTVSDSHTMGGVDS